MDLKNYIKFETGEIIEFNNISKKFEGTDTDYKKGYGRGGLKILIDYLLNKGVTKEDIQKVIVNDEIFNDNLEEKGKYVIYKGIKIGLNYKLSQYKLQLNKFINSFDVLKNSILKMDFEGEIVYAKSYIIFKNKGVKNINYIDNSFEEKKNKSDYRGYIRGAVKILIDYLLDNGIDKEYIKKIIKNKNLFTSKTYTVDYKGINLSFHYSKNDLNRLFVKFINSFDLLRESILKVIILGDIIYEKDSKINDNESNSSLKNKEFISNKKIYEIDLNKFEDNKKKFNILNILSSLKSQSFIILTGPSGTGKTSLIEELVKNIYSNDYNKYYKYIPVKPNWTDSTELLGFYNPITKDYYSGAIIDIIINAYKDWEENREKSNPYFILLDEINLSRVEYYMAEILSLIETIDKEGFSNFYSLFSLDGQAKEKYKNKGFIIEGDKVGIKLTKNLFFIGTANIDETTHGFSNKVLDRTHVIELSCSLIKENDFYPNIQNNIFTFFDNIILEEKYKEEYKFFKDIAEINNTNIYCWRTYKSIVNYLEIIKKYVDIENESIIYQYVIIQKVLPRIKGYSDDKDIVDILKYIQNKFFEKFEIKDKDIEKEILYKKIERMKKGDFISFWK